MRAIDCILVREADGTEVFYPSSDYASNPRVGSIVVHHKSAWPEPVIDTVVREVKAPPIKRRTTYGLYSDRKFNMF